MLSSLTTEFHCHTIASRDSINRIEPLLAAARRKGIDRLVITDHSSIRGALAAQKLDPQLVIVGEEVMTDRGELLAAFVTEEVPRGLPWREALRRLHDQGAFISVSHPFDLRRHGWPEEQLLELIPYVDAIEVFNSRCSDSAMNTQAAAFARQHELAGTVGSDAHLLFELGRATLRLPPFASADELRAVIRQGVPATRLSSEWVHVGSGLARGLKRWARYRMEG